MIFDFRYILFVMLPAMLLMGFAQLRLRSAYGKYREIPNGRGITGAQAAQLVMRNAGVHDVGIEPIAGELSDHFDPRAKMLRLSEPIYNGRSIAALSVAAHEAGHAVQQNVGYAPMTVRAALVPVANIGSGLGPLIVIGGLFTQLSGLAWAGVILFGAATLFALVTLPVEYNASARARQLLEANGIVTRDEIGGVRDMLNAAALTYVASFAGALLTLLYYVMLVSGMSRRSDD
jgi:Zn-dependent membrane protease YugP